MISTCLFCSKEFKYIPSQRKGIYCSNKCQADYAYNKNVSDWLSGKISGKIRDNRPSEFVRKFLMEESNSKCSQCGWGEPNPINGIVYLEIDHIDGIRKNGTRENLRLLCPNCHSLTSTYKTLNKNTGHHKNRRQLT